MRAAPNIRVEKYRVTEGPLASDESFGNNGAFMIPHRGQLFCVIASDEDGWDHVSVSFGSRSQRCPTWDEMCVIKDMFFRDDETVFQYHPAKADYVNHHPYCLHLWRPQEAEMPKPPTWMVGPVNSVFQSQQSRG